jgi:hypothetical protein
MSYSYHTNRVLFTPGQINRMVSTLVVRYPLVWENPRVYWPDETAGVGLPQVSLSVSPLTVQQGDNVLITWNVNNADTIESYGFDAQNQPNGSIVLENVQESVDIRLVGINAAGRVQSLKRLTVELPFPKPEVSISVSPVKVPYNGTATVTWTAKNVSSIVPSGFRATGYNGSTVLENLTQSGEVSITGNSDTHESVTATARYSVDEPPPVIRGCTDSTATNYNPEATEDDGSCVYAPVTPEVTFFEQMNVTDFGKEVEVSFLIKNATSYRITAIDDEYEFSVEGDVEYKTQPTNLIASFKGEDFLEELGWRDSVSGRYALGSATEYEDSDGKGVMFGKDITEVLEFSDLRHTDYTYKIKFKPKVIGNVKSIISKRIHHSNNQSWLFLFTFTNNRVFWDNTTNLNRMDSGVTPVVDEVMNIHVTRDLGMWINGVKVAEGGSPNVELVNDAILRIGNDHTADNRGLEGVIYEIEIYNKSIEG